MEREGEALFASRVSTGGWGESISGFRTIYFASEPNRDLAGEMRDGVVLLPGRGGVEVVGDEVVVL